MRTKVFPSRFGRGLGLAILSILLVVSCSGLGGKPNTSAPNVSDEEMNEYGIKGAVYQACNERQEEIAEWRYREIERMIKSKHPNEHSEEFDRIEEEFEASTKELWENCDAKWREILFGG